MLHLCACPAPPLRLCAAPPAQAFLLETDNKKLVRALQREVGDDVPLPKVLEEGGDWKGRREQIASLREQLKQLKEAQVRRRGGCLEEGYAAPAGGCWAGSTVQRVRRQQ
jgi:hypothetical protein